jgi:hypothetical protein
MNIIQTPNTRNVNNDISIPIDETSMLVIRRKRPTAVVELESDSQDRDVSSSAFSWDLVQNITAMSFATTAFNTGIRHGACFLLEKAIGRNLLNLACRHHVHELLVKKCEQRHNENL